MGALFRKGRHIKKPAQVIRRRGTVFYKLGNQHPGYVVIELVTHAVVFVGAIGHGKLCIVGQALGNIAPMQQPIIGNRVGDALLYRVHGSIPPAAGNQIQQKGVRLDVGTVDKPVIIRTMDQHIGQFLADKLGAVGQHGNVAGSLQIIERCVIIDAVDTIIALLRQGRHAGIGIALPAADHFAITVIRPAFNNIIRQLQEPILIKFHCFAV